MNSEMITCSAPAPDDGQGMDQSKKVPIREGNQDFRQRPPNGLRRENVADKMWATNRGDDMTAGSVFGQQDNHNGTQFSSNEWEEGGRLEGWKVGRLEG